MKCKLIFLCGNYSTMNKFWKYTKFQEHSWICAYGISAIKYLKKMNKYNWKFILYEILIWVLNVIKNGKCWIYNKSERWKSIWKYINKAMNNIKVKLKFIKVIKLNINYINNIKIKWFIQNKMNKSNETLFKNSINW